MQFKKDVQETLFWRFSNFICTRPKSKLNEDFKFRKIKHKKNDLIHFSIYLRVFSNTKTLNKFVNLVLANFINTLFEKMEFFLSYTIVLYKIQ